MAPTDKITVISKSISEHDLTPTLIADTMLNPLDSLTYPTQKPLWVRIRAYNQLFLSEFLGTFIFLLFSFGANAQASLSDNKAGNWTTLCLGWAAGITLGALTATQSGSHLNPAVTLTLCLLRRTPYTHLPIYTLAQTLGAFLASGLVYSNYSAAIHSAATGSNTSGIFATYPTTSMTTSTAFLDEFLGTAILLFCIFALTSRTHGANPKAVPFALGIVFLGISAGFGWETGFAINPARDFGPRLMTWCLGYGTDVWSAGGYYFWVPLVAPCCGGVFGGLVFDLLLGEGEDTPVNRPYMGLGWLVVRKRTGEGGIV